MVLDEADVRLIVQMAEYSRDLYRESSPAHVDALDRVLAALGEPVPYRYPTTMRTLRFDLGASRTTPYPGLTLSNRTTPL